MIIDILIILLAIVAVFMGYRRGFIVQLCHLIGLYLGVLIAPNLATPVGSNFTEDPGLAYIIGFAIILVIVMLLVWIVAPVLRKIIVWKALQKFDAILGAILTFITTTIIAAVACSVFYTANIGDMSAERVMELGRTEMSEEERADLITKLENRDPEVISYFEGKYIDFATLDESILFNFLVGFGDAICPGLEDFKDTMVDIAIDIAANEHNAARN